MADSCCEKTINVRALEVKQRRVLVTVLGINAATFLVMIAAALQSRSTSLLSGGLDNFGDAATYALSIAVVGANSKAKARVALFKAHLSSQPHSQLRSRSAGVWPIPRFLSLRPSA